MSYLVLARKWRPRNFSEMVGQEHVLRALINALDHDRLHHAYLFSGTRGVGKTTIARIFSKSLNCDRGISSQPCGDCASCTEIDEGRFVDLIEVDAASRTKVDDTRELLENVQYAPTRGRFKVYLIDEVHMLSQHSFNALLKTLEEPPPHVKFLLATTDPQKLPVTVLSRCLQFNLKRLSLEKIVERLQLITGKEGIGADAAALRLLGKAAEGSMRDALSLLDQAIAFGGGQVREAETRTMLGTIDSQHVVKVLDALAKGDAQQLMQQAAALAEDVPDYEGVLVDIASLLQKIAIFQVVPDSGLVEEELHAVQELAPRLSPEDVQLFYQIAIQGRRDLGVAPNRQSGFEMTLLRMLAFRPQGIEPAGGNGPAPADTGRDSGRQTAEGPPSVRHSASQAPAPKIQQVAPAPPNEAGGQNWSQLIDAMELKGVTRQLAANCIFLGREDEVVSLQLDPRSKHLLTDNVRRNLQKELSRHFATSVNLRILLNEPAQETPARRIARQESERLQQARDALEQDPNIQALKATFGASIQEESVRPLDD